MSFSCSTDWERSNLEIANHFLIYTVALSRILGWSQKQFVTKWHLEIYWSPASSAVANATNINLCINLYRGLLWWQRSGDPWSSEVLMGSWISKVEAGGRLRGAGYVKTFGPLDCMTSPNNSHKVCIYQMVRRHNSCCSITTEHGAEVTRSGGLGWSPSPWPLRKFATMLLLC